MPIGLHISTGKSPSGSWGAASVDEPLGIRTMNILQNRFTGPVRAINLQSLHPVDRFMKVFRSGLPLSLVEVNGVDNRRYEVANGFHSHRR